MLMKRQSYMYIRQRKNAYSASKLFHMEGFTARSFKRRRPTCVTDVDEIEWIRYVASSRSYGCIFKKKGQSSHRSEIALGQKTNLIYNFAALWIRQG